MTLFETQSGRGVEIALPHTQWEELERVRIEWEGLKKERRVTATRLSSLAGERERAITKDRDALASAIREGKSDPGDESVEKVEKEIQACNRMIEALDVALEDAERDLIAVVDQYRDDWAEEVEGAFEGVRQEYGEAVEALASAYRKVVSTYALLRWVKLFPDQEMSYRVRGMTVNALRGMHGDAFLFDEVLAALRSDAYEVMQERTIERHVTESQALHEARRKNELAGRGYFTDRELARVEENPVEFFHGVGAKKIEPQKIEG